MSAGHGKDRRTPGVVDGTCLPWHSWATAARETGQTNTDAMQPAEACDLIPRGGARNSAARGPAILSRSLTQAMALSFR